MPATVRASSISVPVSAQAKHSLWTDLASRSGGAQPATGLYSKLRRRLDVSPAELAAPGAELWGALERRANPALYRPAQVPGVVEETVEEQGQRYVVLRSPGGRYLRLAPAERELWGLMDGTQSVEQLATQGFLRFRQLLPVAGLVASLRAEGFLRDTSTGLYGALRRQVAARTVEGWGQRITGVLRQHTFAIGGVDTTVGAIYRWGGRLLFGVPGVILIALISLIGLVCFGLLAANPVGRSVIDTDNAVVSLLALWGALLVSFALHELAHALAVKHFRRTVLRGGVMIYFGMPAAFVDTSDIWLAGRRARIITSLAGPVCDLLLGSVAAITALFTTGLIGDAAFKLALAGYLAALCNLNPLLELDGYYMLSDWLGLPNLRRRALAFISGPLWQKLRVRAELGREERIFALYGTLAAVYTVLAVLLAFFFWQTQLVQIIAQLWTEGGLLGRLLAVVIVLGGVLPLGLGLLVAAWGLVRAGAAWLGRHGYSRSPAVVAGALALLSLALAGLPLRFGDAAGVRLLALALWGVALAAQLALRADYRRAAVARALDCFLAVTVIEGVALLGFTLVAAINNPAVTAPLNSLWVALENVGFALLLFAGFVALLDIDLRQSPPAELAGSALLMALAFLAGGAAIGLLQAAAPSVPFALHILSAAPVYCSAVALALLLPQVAGLRDSRLLWSWLLLWLGIAAQTGAYVLGVLDKGADAPATRAAALLASGLWAAAWCSHYVALRQGGPRALSWPLEPAQGEAERLQRAFRHSYAGLYRMLREHHGARRARALDDRMDVLAATANWGITLDREEARIGAELAAHPLDAQGGRYAEVLRYTVAVIEGLAGATFARRAIQAAYDALPWPEREAADRRCFPNTPWARELSRTFGDAREGRMRLLRQVERFAACDDAELRSLAEALEPRSAAAGALLLGEGETPPGLWIVEAGEVVARKGGAVADELHRGSCFGATGAAVETPAAHAYRASLESALLFLSAHELRRLVASAAPHVADAQALVAAVQTLERAPFFHDLPRETLRGLARVAERLELPPRTPIIRQGLPSGRIYVLAQGEAAVVRHEPLAAGEAGTAKLKLVARLGPDELFGELELLKGTPPQASVVALTPVVVLAIPHSAVQSLVHGGGAAAGLERLGTGRLRDLRAT